MAGGPPPVVSSRGLALGYGARTVLEGVDLEVAPGEFWFLVGPNGQGKTTLLRAILGEIRPRAGELQVAVGPASIGFVPQRCEINPTLPTTVREFVTLGLVGTGCPRKEEPARLAWALDHVDLAGLAERDYWSLSGGQRQRALVARALVRRPAFLIADEPTNGLDLAAETALLQALADLNRSERLTVLFVTHDLALAARYASHFAVFLPGEGAGRPGRVATGRASELAPEQLERAYGVPAALCRAALGQGPGGA